MSPYSEIGSFNTRNSMNYINNDAETPQVFQQQSKQLFFQNLNRTSIVPRDDLSGINKSVDFRNRINNVNIT